jgi:exodeoxyribonuclease-5
MKSKLTVETGKIKLSNSIDWTEDQYNAADKIIKWFNDGKDIMFTLGGFAGTGKTTLLREIVKHIRSTVAISAPTHIAVRIASTAVGIQGQTIHKLLGLRPNVTLESFDYNNPQFDPKGNKAIKNYGLVIIDEASMIPYGLHQLIKDEAKEYHVKILYVGDPYQLPPVNEKVSIAFKNPNIFNLTKIVRQEESNPLIILLSKLREDIKYNTRGYISYLSKNNNSLLDEEGFLSTKDISHFCEIMTDDFNTHEFERNIDFAKYLSFTNESVLHYNKYIRNFIINNNDTLLCGDDLLVAYSTILDEFNVPTIINSENYIINDISNYTNMDSIKGFLVSFKVIVDGTVTNPMFIIDHNDIDSISIFSQIITKLINDAKNATNSAQRASRWKDFYSFKNSNLLMTNLVTATNKKFVDKDIDYGFGLTVHKSQGCTFDNVFVNLRDILYSNTGLPYSNIELSNKLAYVALSRARSKAIILL